MSNVSGLYLYANCFSEIFRITTFYTAEFQNFGFFYVSLISSDKLRSFVWRFHKVFFRFPGGSVRWINRHWHWARRHYTTRRQYWESGWRAERAPCKTLSRAGYFFANCKCGANHEKFNPTEWKNCKGGERMRPRVRLRIYLIHNLRSCGTVSTGETKNYQRRRYFRDFLICITVFFRYLVCAEYPWLWSLCRAAETVLDKVPRVGEGRQVDGGRSCARRDDPSAGSDSARRRRPACHHSGLSAGITRRPDLFQKWMKL